MTDYDNRGKVSLWKPDTTHEKAPAASGTVFAHRDIKEGERLSIALWRNQSDNPNAPVLKGKISDPRPAKDVPAAPTGGGFRDKTDDFKEDDLDRIPF